MAALFCQSHARQGGAILIRIEDPDDPRIAMFRDIRERDLVGRERRFVAEGKVVLNVLSEYAPESIEALLVLENRLRGIEHILERLNPATPVFVASTAVIDSIAGFHLHRGLIAIARCPVPPDPVAFLQSLGTNSLVVVASGIFNHDNIGTIFRNAAAFEAAAVVLDDACCDPFYRKAMRVSVGAALKVPHIRLPDLSTICDALQRLNFVLGALSPQGTSVMEKFPKAGRRALILGTEGPGLPHSALAAIPSYRIAMSSGFDSLNVGTACGIALYHASAFSIHQEA